MSAETQHREHMAGENKYIICCDFDGVLNSYKSGWKGPTVIDDPPVPGAMAWLELMTNDTHFAKFEVAIYSSRSKEEGGVRSMTNWLHKHLAEYFQHTHSWDRRNAHVLSENILKRLTFPTQKPAASMTIDDRAFHFQGRFPSVDWLLNFKPWTKRIGEGPRHLQERPSQERLKEIRREYEEIIEEAGGESVHLDPQDYSIGELLAEIDHLNGVVGGDKR